LLLQRRRLPMAIECGVLGDVSSCVGLKVPTTSHSSALILVYLGKQCYVFTLVSVSDNEGLFLRENIHIHTYTYIHIKIQIVSPVYVF